MVLGLNLAFDYCDQQLQIGASFGSFWLVCIDVVYKSCRVEAGFAKQIIFSLRLRTLF